MVSNKFNPEFLIDADKLSCRVSDLKNNPIGFITISPTGTVVSSDCPQDIDRVKWFNFVRRVIKIGCSLYEHMPNVLNDDTATSV